MKAKRLLVSLAAFLLSSFIIVYIIVQLVSGLTTDVAYRYANVTEIDDALEKNGYIVRNETVVYAAENGVITYAANESQKVGVNQLIATVFTSDQGVDIQNQIDRLDEKIDILERCAVDTSYLTSDVNKIDNKIYSSLFSSKKAVLNDDISLASSEKEDLLISFNKRQLITTNAAHFKEQIENLRAQKDALTASLQTPLCSVYCETPGYFSTLLDGYESTYTPDVVKNLTVDSYHDLIATDETVHSENAIGKVITDFHWYTLCELTNKEAEEFAEGRSYYISYLYTSGKKIEAILEKKVTQTDKDTVVMVFRIEEIPADFDYTRSQTIKIIKSSASGISFPRSALRVVDGVQGVYVVAGNSVGFKKVNIIYENGSDYISKENNEDMEDPKSYLSRFDRVITEGKNLYVGKVLD